LGVREIQKIVYPWNCESMYNVGRLIMKFHTVMAEPFTVRADQIRNFFSQSDAEKNSVHPVQINISLNEKISYIRTTCAKKIETATHYRIRNSNLLLLVFLHEDISKICNESAITQSENLEKMKNIKEDFLTLAFIGDRALELGILPSLWDEENNSRDIPQKGNLDMQKKNFVENKNLGSIWDSLDLYDNKILTKKKKESQKLRAARMEAVFGIIYLEGGLEAVETSLINLRKYSEKHNT
jgi:hypothetical protein